MGNDGYGEEYNKGIAIPGWEGAGEVGIIERAETWHWAYNGGPKKGNEIRIYPVIS